MSEVVENADGTLEFRDADIDYSDESLNQVWSWIRDDLAEQGRVYNHQIAEKHEDNPAGYARTTLEDVLSKLRPVLNRNQIIDVDYESRSLEADGKGGATRTIWVIDE